MESICHPHQQVSKWQRNWNGQDSPIPCSNMRHEKTQVYGAILPKDLTNQAMLESKAYKTYYAFASREKTPKLKYVRKKVDSDTSPKQKSVQANKGTKLKTSAKVAKSDKKKQPAKMPKSKGLDVLSKVALTEASYQKKQYIISQLSRRWLSQDDEDAKEESDDDSEETKSDNNGDDLTHPNLSTYRAGNQEEEEEKKLMTSNQKVSTPPDYEFTDKEENKEGDDKDKEGKQEQDKEDDLYRDLNINLERSDAKMTDAQANQDTEDTHVTLTTVPRVVQQQSSSVSSDLVSKFINTSSDTGIDSILNQNTQSDTLVNMKEVVGVAVQLQSNKLREEAQAKNQEFLNQVDSTIKAIIKEQVKDQDSRIMPQIEKYVTKALRAEVLVKSTNQPQTSYAIAGSLSEFKLKKILFDKIETNKSIDRSDIHKDLYNALVESYNTDKDIITSYGDVVTLKRGRDDQDKDEDPFIRSNRGSKRRKSDQSHQEFNTANDDVTPITQMAQAAGTQSSFNEFLATLDFSAFIHRLKIGNLTQKVLTGPAYAFIKGTCKSVVELEYHLEEVFKATNDRLDWHNPEGKPYPYDLNKPPPLILNEQGHQVIPQDYFINNDFKYLKGESLSQKYTTSVTKLKAADYGKLRWVEDNQNQRDLPRDIPLDTVVVLKYEKRSKSENKGKVPSEMELELEQTQQVKIEILLEPTSKSSW
nr:hypothetical protein [Tanacetum cinerariifolium]